MPAVNFQGGGISREIKKIRFVYGHLNAIQHPSMQQRCSVTFKMHQIFSLQNAEYAILTLIFENFSGDIWHSPQNPYWGGAALPKSHPGGT